MMIVIYDHKNISMGITDKSGSFYKELFIKTNFMYTLNEYCKENNIKECIVNDQPFKTCKSCFEIMDERYFETSEYKCECCVEFEKMFGW